MNRGLTILTAGVVSAAATVVLGWWGIPAVAVGWMLARPTTRPLDLALGAAMAWGGLLAWRAATGPVHVVADRLGPILGAPGWVVELATVLYPFLLAWSLAAFVRALRSPRPQPDARP